MSDLAPTPTANLVDPVDAAWDDLEREQWAERYRAGFWDGHERIAAALGCQIDVKRSAARWASNTFPPQLLEATVRFKRPGYKRPKTQRRKR